MTTKSSACVRGPISLQLPSLVLSAAICIAIGGFSSGARAEPYVAGTDPSKRPAAAPKIKAVVRDDAFFDSALHGVSKPYPPSLMFLKDQGNWYSPFTHPGMHGLYDIRQWHSPWISESSARKEPSRR